MNNEAVELLIQSIYQHPRDWALEVLDKDKIRQQKRWHVAGDSASDGWFVCTRRDGIVVVAYGWCGAHTVEVPELQPLKLSRW